MFALHFKCKVYIYFTPLYKKIYIFTFGEVNIIFIMRRGTFLARSRPIPHQKRRETPKKATTYIPFYLTKPLKGGII